MNWLFTWLRPDGPLTHEAMSGVVADLFFGGLPAVHTPAPAKAPRRRAPSARTRTPTLSTTEGDTP